jgi:hypothetical protein
MMNALQLLAFFRWLFQHDDNTFVDDGFGGTSHPGGDN